MVDGMDGDSFEVRGYFVIQGTLIVECSPESGARKTYPRWLVSEGGLLLHCRVSC